MMLSKEKIGKLKNIVIVSHKYVTHPDDDLILFLNTKKKKMSCTFYIVFLMPLIAAAIIDGIRKGNYIRKR